MQSSDELWAHNFTDIIGSIPSPKPSWKGPKGCIEKAVRRRPRASKKAPTTLLTAEPSNFQALVQQFTGYRSAAPLLRAYKGPINLNFKQRSCYLESQQPKGREAGFQLHEESDNRCGFSRFGAKDGVAAGDEDDEDRESFVPIIDENPRAEALTYDCFELDKFCGEEVYMWGSEATNHEFWGG